jgi:hypothetical protein
MAETSRVDYGVERARRGGSAGTVAAIAVLALGAGAARAGEAPCWLDHGAVVVAAALGDVAGDFIVDLSRPTSALHVTRANSDGVEADAVAAPLEIAGERIAALQVPVLDLDPQTRAFDTSINGIIGWDALRRWRVALDLRRGGCRLVLGSRTAGRGRDVRLPLREIAGAPAVPALATDGSAVRAGLFRLDTAQEATVIDGSRLSHLAPPGGAPVRLRAVEFAGALFEQVPAGVGSSRSSAVEGSLGLGVLRGAMLTLDAARGEVWVTPPGQ